MDAFKRISQSASHVGGAAAATATATSALGSPGHLVLATTATAAATTVAREVWDIGSDVLTRHLSKSERDRIATLSKYASECYQSNLAIGNTVRTDDFFKDEPGGRNAGRELVEGVLMAGAKSFEERKLRHLGCLMANIAFSPDVSSYVANRMIGLAEEFSWLRFVIIAGIARSERIVPPDTSMEHSPQGWDDWSVRREIDDLYESRYIHGADQPGAEIRGFPALPIRDLSFRTQKLMNPAQLFHNLLELDQISDSEIIDMWAMVIVSTPSPTID